MTRVSPQQQIYSLEGTLKVVNEGVIYVDMSIRKVKINGDYNEKL